MSGSLIQKTPQNVQQSVQQKIGNIALLVADYDNAIAFYTGKLQFSLIADTDLGGGKRW